MSVSFNRKRKRSRLIKRAEKSQVLTKIIHKRLSEYLEELNKATLDFNIPARLKTNIYKKYEKVFDLLKKPVSESK